MTDRISSVCKENKRWSALPGGSMALIKGVIFSLFSPLLRARLKFSHVWWEEGLIV